MGGAGGALTHDQQIVESAVSKRPFQMIPLCAHRQIESIDSLLCLSVG
jgi:hypothetical protein